MLFASIAAIGLLFALGLVALMFGFLAASYLWAAGRRFRDVPVLPADRAQSVTIVVPVYNEDADAAEACIGAVAALEHDGPLQLVLVDDGSDPSKYAELELVYRAQLPALSSQGIRAQLIRRPENTGKRAAMAAGVDEASGEIVVFLDSDSAPRVDALAHTAAAFRDPRVGAAGARIVVANARRSWLTRLLGARYALDHLQRLVQARGRPWPWGGSEDRGSVWCPPGAWLAVRAKPLRAAIEAFLAEGVPWGDDVALPRIIRTLEGPSVPPGGWRIGYAEAALVATNVPETLGRLVRQQAGWWRKNWTYGLLDLRERRGAGAFATAELLSRLLVPAPVILGVNAAAAMALANWPLAWAPLLVVLAPLAVVPVVAIRARDASLLGLIPYFYGVHMTAGYVARWHGWRIRRTKDWLRRDGKRPAKPRPRRRRQTARIAGASLMVAPLLPSLASLAPLALWGIALAKLIRPDRGAIESRRG